jgi:hypothetical protein
VSTPFDQPSTLATTDPEGGTGAYSFDGKPDRWKRYRLPHPVTGKAGGFTRATTFAKTISDTFALNQWALRMGGDGLVMRPDLLMQLASTTDAQGKNKIMEQAKEAAGAKVGANLGTALHAFSEAVDRGEEPNIPPPYRPHMAAYTALMEQYGLEVVEIEKVVLCQTYDIAGTLDRIVRFTKDVTVDLVGGGTYTFAKGMLAILDLKTGKDLSYGWLEISIQLAVYAQAENIWDKGHLSWTPMPEVDKQVALVVHLPATAPGETVKATMYAVDIASGWADADLCAQVRAARKKKGLATALAVVEEEPAAPLIDPAEPLPGHAALWVPDVVREPTLAERAQAARTEEELTTIWWEAVRKREDTKGLADVIRKRKGAILADTAAG